MAEPSFALVDVNGVSHTLALDTNGYGIAVEVGAKGLGMPPLTVNSNKLPYAPGAALSRIATPPSTINIPLFIKAANALAAESYLDQLTGWVLPGTERSSVPSTVRFQVTASDGVARELEGVCVGGLDDDDSMEAMGDIWNDVVLSLTCVDPYPRDVALTTHTYTGGAGLHSWWPYYPLDLTPAIYSRETITNSGHVECWPIWTITGPGAGPVLTNQTSGEILDLSALTLAAGDVVTIDSSERGATAKTITNQNGVNLWYLATTDSIMWPLYRGANDVIVSMTGTTGASAVSMVYRLRWTRLRRR